MRRREMIRTFGTGLVGLGAWGGMGIASQASEEDTKGKRQIERPRGLLVPTKMFMTSATAVHERRARADDLLLCRAGIGNCNRVEVSSIVPPGCKLISRKEGEGYLHDGQVIFAVLGKNDSSTPGLKIATAIGMAIPEDGGTGCISEAQSEGPETSAAHLTQRAVEAALGMLALRRNVTDFDPHKEYDPRKTTYHLGSNLVRIYTVSEEATVDSEGHPTFVLSSVVFIM